MISATALIFLAATASVVTLAYTVGTQSALDSLDNNRNAARIVMRSAMEIAQAELYAAARSTTASLTFEGKCNELANGDLDRDLGSDRIYFRKFGSETPHKTGTKDGKPWASCTFIAGGVSAGRTSEILGQIQAVTTTATSLNFQGKDKKLFSITGTSGVANSALLTHVAFNRDGQGEPRLLMVGKSSPTAAACEDKLNHSPRCITWFTKATASNGSAESNSAGGFMSLGTGSEAFTLSGTFSHNKKFAGVGLLLYPQNSSVGVTHHGSNTGESTSLISTRRHEAGFSSSWQCGARTVLSDKLSPADWSNNNGSWFRASQANVLLASIASTLSSSNQASYELEIGNSTSTSASRSVAMSKLSEKIADENAMPTPISQVWFAYNDAIEPSSGSSLRSGLMSVSMPTATTNPPSTPVVLFNIQGKTYANEATRIEVTQAPEHPIRYLDAIVFQLGGSTIRARIVGGPCGQNPCSLTGDYQLARSSSTPTTSANVSVGISREHHLFRLSSNFTAAPREGTAVSLVGVSLGSFAPSVLRVSRLSADELAFQLVAGQPPKAGDALFGQGIPARTVIESINDQNTQMKLRFLDEAENGLRLGSMPSDQRIVALPAVVGSLSSVSRIELSRGNTTSSRDLCGGVCPFLRETGGSTSSFDKLYFRGPGDTKVSWDLSCLRNVDSTKLVPDEGFTQNFVEVSTNTWMQPIQ
jgi:hypothetical protein